MKTKRLVLAIIAIVMGITSYAQKQIDKSGHIHIYSATSLFIIEADNNSVASVLNTETGDVVVSVLVRSFKFHEALVEEHFNENYMESHLYPKSQFKGKIVNNSAVNYSKDGVYQVEIEGDLTMHGTTNHIKEKATITIKGGKVSATTTFNVSLAAYKIKVEESYKDRISDEIKLVCTFNFSPITK